MTFNLRPLRDNEMTIFKKDMQESFQQGAVEGFGSWEEEVLPESHIDRSLHTPGSIAYVAIVDGELIGGAVVVIDEENAVGDLHLLYVKYGVQSKGIGLKIWTGIETLHPNVRIWKTCTPYFEKRNIHFYVNLCGFHIVQFYNKHFPDPDLQEDDEIENSDIYFDGMFQFEKIMPKN